MRHSIQITSALLLSLAAAQLPAKTPKPAPAETARAAAETARAENYARLRADYAASPAYDPRVPSQTDINTIRTQLLRKQNTLALQTTDKLLAKNPVSAELHDYRSMALAALGKTADAAAETDAKQGIQDAILRTGDGATPATAIRILNPLDIQSVAEKLGSKITAQKTEADGAHTYSIVTVQIPVRTTEKVGAGTRVRIALDPKTLYFNTDAITNWQTTRANSPPRPARGASVKIGAATVASPGDDDSMPVLVSTTGGGGGSRSWGSFQDLQKAAANDDPAALLELGLMYLDGSADTPKNTSQALMHLENAARLGNRDANFRLGKLYADGDSVPQDYARALGYYTAAARAGNPVAQHNVGAMLASGRGVKRDYPEALAWLILAAKKNPDAASSEKQLRLHLASRPDTIAAGEARAAELAREIAAQN